jgi:hypothetical protein
MLADVFSILKPIHSIGGKNGAAKNLRPILGRAAMQMVIARIAAAVRGEPALDRLATMSQSHRMNCFVGPRGGTSRNDTLMPCP